MEFSLSPPEGMKFSTLKMVPGEKEYLFEVDQDGRLQAVLEDLVDFRMLVAEYQ